MASGRAVEPASSSGVGPALLLGGAGFLFYRTIALLTGDARTVLEHWTWSGVVFAGVMSVLGFFGVLVVWPFRRR
jgi:hypothetical protein